MLSTSTPVRLEYASYGPECSYRLVSVKVPCWLDSSQLSSPERHIHTTQFQSTPCTKSSLQQSGLLRSHINIDTLDKSRMLIALPLVAIPLVAVSLVAISLVTISLVAISLVIWLIPVCLAFVWLATNWRWSSLRSWRCRCHGSVVLSKGLPTRLHLFGVNARSTTWWSIALASLLPPIVIDIFEIVRVYMARQVSKKRQDYVDEQI
jgi:hypothetical protein